MYVLSSNLKWPLYRLKHPKHMVANIFDNGHVNSDSVSTPISNTLDKIYVYTFLTYFQPHPMKNKSQGVKFIDSPCSKNTHQHVRLSEIPSNNKTHPRFDSFTFAPPVQLLLEVEACVNPRNSAEAAACRSGAVPMVWHAARLQAKCLDLLPGYKTCKCRS